MHFAFVLAGLGTALLGPILPVLAHMWRLQDKQSGLLLMAQMAGAFLGGLTTSGDLRRGLLAGLASGAVGWGMFALAPGLPWACMALLLAGFGVGRVIACVNIMAGRRYTQKRAAALAFLNFSWSFGAMLAPLGAAWLLPHFRLRDVLFVFSAMYVVAGIGLILETGGAMPEARAWEDQAGAVGLSRGVFVYFALMLLLYGGLETCLSGWLTTYALRYGSRTLLASEYTTLLLWMALTVGRAGSSVLLLRFSERKVLRSSLGLVAVLIVGLYRSHTTGSIAVCTVLLGLSLAPFFPATFALVMGRKPKSREAGVILAVSGLGAAGLPPLMGWISTRSGSLGRALLIPLGAAVVLWVMSVLLLRRGAGPGGGIRVADTPV